MLICFIAILITGTAGFLLFFENDVYAKHSWQHGLAYGALILVGFIGYIAWTGNPQKWLIIIWTLTYSIVATFLLFFKLIDIIIGFGPSSYLGLYKLRNLFISPLPFLLLYLLSTKLSSSKTEKPL